MWLMATRLPREGIVNSRQGWYKDPSLTGESSVTEPIIRVVDLWKSYREDEGGNGAALRGVSLELARGEVLALMGKSGSGKTTLLNLLAGLDRPTRGLIEIEGRNLEALGEQGRTQMRRKRLGFVFQFFNLLPTLTAFENVSLPLELAGRADSGRRAPGPCPGRPRGSGVALPPRALRRRAAACGDRQGIGQGARPDPGG